MENIGDKVKDHVKSQLYNLINKTWDYVENNVYDDVSNDVWDQVGIPVSTQLGDQVKNNSIF